MSLPEPKKGIVIKYAYLWHDDSRRGLEEGKDRPCLIVGTKEKEDGRLIVSVAPITHTRPKDHELTACAIPAETTRRIGLDHEQSWIIATEVNRFEWPGADLRPVSGRKWEYGVLPHGMQKIVQGRLRENIERQQVKSVSRDEAFERAFDKVERQEAERGNKDTTRERE